MLVIDPATNQYNEYSIAGLTGNYKWAGAVAGVGSKFYGIPFTSQDVLVVDVDTHGTGHARLRQPSYRGLRDDLSPGDLRDQS